MVILSSSELDDGRKKSSAAIATANKDDEEKEEVEDRMSSMPDHIIHHIMSFLPSTIDAMALSMVCKTFSSAFLCFPVIDFDLNHCHSDFKRKTLFLDSMVNYLQSRPLMIGLDKLRFVAGRHAFALSRSYCFGNVFDTMVRLVTDNNVVKELELDFSDCFEDQCLSLPPPTLPPQVFSSRTIRVLKLKGILQPRQLLRNHQDLIISCPSMENLTLIGCSFIGSITLGSNYKLKLVKIIHHKLVLVEGPVPRLEHFSCFCEPPHWRLDITSSTCPKLKHLRFNAQGIQEPWIKQCSFSGFHFLETLKLYGGCKLKEIKFQLQSLRILKLCFVNFTKIDMDAPNLVSLIFMPQGITPSEINVSSSTGNLKHLYFNGVDVPQRWVAQNFSQFSFLETLKLVYCYKLKEIKFHLQYLKTLELDCVELERIDIEAPNLVSLIYKENIFPSNRPPVIDMSSSSSTNLKLLHFSGINVPRRWVERNFSEFRFLQTLKLNCSCQLKEIKFHLEYLNEMELYEVDFIKVDIEAPNLVSLTYISRTTNPLEINMSNNSFRNLKHLSFAGQCVRPTWNFTEFGFLDALELSTQGYHFPQNKVNFRLKGIVHVKMSSTAKSSDTWFAPLLTLTSKAKSNVNLDNHFRNWKISHREKEKMDLTKMAFWRKKSLKHLKAESGDSHPDKPSLTVDPKGNSLKFYIKNANEVEMWQIDLEKVVDKRRQ